jgi:hypothetical protein
VTPLGPADTPRQSDRRVGRYTIHQARRIAANIAHNMRAGALRNEGAVSGSFSPGDLNSKMLVAGVAHLGLAPSRANMRYHSALCA